jgi:hypothetical protein
MSYYSVRNPNNFVTQDPNILTQQSIQFLKNGFQQPFEEIIEGADVTYTPEQFLKRYIVRDNLGGATSNDVTPTAADLIEALNNNQWIKRTNQLNQDVTVQNGFYFDVIIYNEGADDVVITGNTGVTIGIISSITINPGKIAVIRVIVTGITAGAEEVYISVLSS